MPGYTPPTEEPQTDEPCPDCGGDCRSAEECDHNRFLMVRRHMVEIVDRRRETHNAGEGVL